jgi:transposase InsO family protein
MDITYIPMERGFVYLAVVLDWFSRRVLSWRVSITMEVAFCVETLEDALARHGKPEIFNTDQGKGHRAAPPHRCRGEVETGSTRNQAGHSQPQQQEAPVQLQQAPLQTALAHRERVQQVERLQAHRYPLRQVGAKLPGLCLSCRCPCMVDLMSLDPSLPKEAPRLCRGGSRSLTFKAVVHRRSFPA